MISIAVGSTLIGTSIAINRHFQTNSSQTHTIPTTQAPQLPGQRVIEQAPQINTQPLSTDELDIVREQLRRAIHDRNPVLLRSLMQASSLRQVLATLAVPEPVNFDNLDASTWAVLERAIAYRCRQSSGRTTSVPTISESVGGCFEPPSQKLLQ